VTLSGYMHGVHSATFSPDGHRLATGGTAIEAVTLWDIHSQERLLTLYAKEEQLSSTAFSSSGNLLAGQSSVGDTAGAVHFWRAPSWEEIEAAEKTPADFARKR
jgi:WD40 repeat protein